MCTFRADRQLYVNDQLPGRFVVSWFEELNTAASTPGPTTVQLILYADGRIQYGYGDVVNPDAVHVDVDPIDAISNVLVDFSAAPHLPRHQQWSEDFISVARPFDLAFSFLVFTPTAERRLRHDAPHRCAGHVRGAGPHGHAQPAGQRQRLATAR